ncbi:hypothetical protein [Neoroseomonas rubea]|uniref:hypothetical protein n=1 Tax=Neoroseomonas rubea TaxID=2748666 RepID=UPI0018DFE54F|nr:hypothetical protein [Roseomonas rubea]
MPISRSDHSLARLEAAIRADPPGSEAVAMMERAFAQAAEEARAEDAARAAGALPGLRLMREGLAAQAARLADRIAEIDAEIAAVEATISAGPAPDRPAAGGADDPVRPDPGSS